MVMGSMNDRETFQITAWKAVSKLIQKAGRVKLFPDSEELNTAYILYNGNATFGAHKVIQSKVLAIITIVGLKHFWSQLLESVHERNWNQQVERCPL